MSKTVNYTGLILKRSNVGETDRIVTILTLEQGKIVTVAKGVRNLHSSKRAFLEPGNIIVGHFIFTKTLPLLTQAKLVASCSEMPASLQNYKQLSQMLEIFDRLFVEEELDEEMYRQILNIRTAVVEGKSGGIIRAKLERLIENLGFHSKEESNFASISEYVASLSDKPVRSYDYLSLSSKSSR